MNNSIVDYLNSTGQASDFSSRSNLAKNSGITNYTGTADQNMALLNSLKAKGTNPDGTATTQSVNTGGAITVDQLSNAKPITTVTPPKYDPTSDKNTIGSIASYVASGFQAADQKRNELLNTQNSNATKQLELMKALTQKEADTQAANDTSGYNAELKTYTDLSTRLAELDARSKSLDRQAQAIPIQDQINAEGKGITDGGLAPITAAQLRNNAIEALTVAQQADITTAAATGSYNKIQLAREKAQQIVDLKYKPLEAELAMRTKQYELNKDLLSSIDKVRTESLGAALELEQTAMANKKADDKLKSDVITKAAPFAPQDLLLKAQAAPDSTSAAIILGKYAQDFLQQEKIKQEVIKLQIENGTYNPSGDIGSATVISKDNGFGLQDYKNGIQSVESRGSKDAYGGNNQYAVITGQKSIAQLNAMSQEEKNKLAYGKFQVLGSNIPSWTKEATGKSMTIEQFLASPQTQEAVFDFQAEKQYAKYGNWGDVASVWFSGRPLANNNSSDGSNTVPEYVQKVFKNMGISNKPTENLSPIEKLKAETSKLKLNEAQSNSLAFGQRAINADLAIRKRLETYDPTTIFSAAGRLLETDNARAFQRDLTDFITAVLRKESGATISEEEFARYMPLYSPQGILTNETDITETNTKRKAAIDALITQSGPAAKALQEYNLAPNSSDAYLLRMMKALDPSLNNNTANTTDVYNGYKGFSNYDL
jgi:hypothetical protein